MKTIRKEIKHNEYVYFSVYVNKKNQKGHNEVYRLPKVAYSLYKKLGYNKAFFEFKPESKGMSAGVYKVNKKSYSNNKVYYHTSNGIYSLPKYLENKLPSQTHIIYSERVARK